MVPPGRRACRGRTPRGAARWPSSRRARSSPAFWLLALRVQQAQRLRAVTRLQLVDDGRDVPAHGALRDAEAAPDPPGRRPLPPQLDHLPLAGGERDGLAAAQRPEPRVRALEPALAQLVDELALEQPR